ncbi:hypothetical protein DFH27DRAFT_531511 [Peziza echinospora]|nr:hypothetical protein DFH27DRAFT_531511 [Peziza echinospora]
MSECLFFFFFSVFNLQYGYGKHDFSLVFWVFVLLFFDSFTSAFFLSMHAHLISTILGETKKKSHCLFVFLTTSIRRRRSTSGCHDHI